MHVDFKGPMSWAGDARASLAEDIVAMANTRDGGLLLVGIGMSPDGSARVDGLSPDQAASFEPTKVGEYVASYFAPAVKITIERPSIDGKQLVAIQVAEFDTSPILCIKDGPEKPASGAKVKRHFYAGNLLVRTPAAKTEVVRAAEDMQALIRLAVTKTSNQLLEDMQRVLEGRSPSPVPQQPHERAVSTWSGTLNDRRELWEKTNPGRGSFSIMFLPSPLAHELDHAALRTLVQRAQVNWQGWSLPAEVYESKRARIQNRAMSVEGTYSDDEIEEIWQAHRSGAFMYSRLLRYLERDSERQLPFEEIVLAVALGVLFAQRFYQDISPDGEVDITCTLLGIGGQRLTTFDTFMRRISGDYRSVETTIESCDTATVTELRSAWRPLVHRLVTELFVLFNWSIAPIVIDQRLDEIEGKRSLR